MPAGVLRRCSICKRFHAAYQVEEGGQKWLLCKRCWDVRCAPKETDQAGGVSEENQSLQHSEQLSY